MAFRPRQPNEDLGTYLKAKQDYEMQSTGQSGVNLGITPQEQQGQEGDIRWNTNANTWELWSPIEGEGWIPTTQEGANISLQGGGRQIESVPLVASGGGGGKKESKTGDELLDKVLEYIQPILDALPQQGKIINPKVEITPVKVAEFMSLASANLDIFLPFAEKEIAPYYKTQLELAKNTFLKDLGYATEDIARFEQDTEKKYGQNLRTLGSTMAQSGLATSGIRKRSEQELAYDTQQQLEEKRRALSQSAERTAGQFAQQWGSQAINIPNITQAPRVLSGIGTFERPQGVSPLYQLSPDVYQGLMGEQQYAERTAKQRRASEFESAYRISEEQRLLNEQ